MRKNIYKELFVVYILALVFAIVFHGNHGAWIDKILTASTFVFAIILGFSIANRKARMTSIRSLLRKDDSYFLIIYENAKIYGDDIRAKVQKALDEYLIVQIDYFLEDFDMATPKLIELYRLLLNIKVPKDFGEDRNKSVISSHYLTMVNLKSEWNQTVIIKERNNGKRTLSHINGRRANLVIPKADRKVKR